MEFLEKGSLKLGKILGTEIKLHWSGFLFLAFMAWIVNAALSFWGVSLSLPLRIFVLAVGAFLGMISLLLHELAHAFFSNKLGFAVKSITIFALGANTELFDEYELFNSGKPGADAIISITGPVANLALAGLMLVLVGIFQNISPWHQVFYLFYVINLFILACFNLLPGLPLDGGRVFRAILWKKFKNFKKAHFLSCRVGRIVGGLMIIGGILMFFLAPLLPLPDSSLISMMKTSSTGFFVIIFGMFIMMAAGATYREYLRIRILKNHKVERLVFSKKIPSQALTFTASSETLEMAEKKMKEIGGNELRVFENNQPIGVIQKKVIDCFVRVNLKKEHQKPM